MKKNALFSAVLAVALFPTVGLSAEKDNSFEQNAQICDSWTWQGQTPSRPDLLTSTSQLNSAQLAFGDHTQNGIGW